MRGGEGSRPRYVFLHTFIFFLTLYPSLKFSSYSAVVPDVKVKLEKMIYARKNPLGRVSI